MNDRLCSAGGGGEIVDTVWFRNEEGKRPTPAPSPSPPLKLAAESELCSFELLFPAESGCCCCLAESRRFSSSPSPAPSPAPASCSPKRCHELT